MTITLFNGVELHNSSPNTFMIPSAADKEAIKPGDCVKLIFCGAECDMPERMWVVVTAIDGDRFTGTLDNEPFVLDGIRFGDEVNFGPEHVIDIHPR